MAFARGPKGNNWNVAIEGQRFLRGFAGDYEIDESGVKVMGVSLSGFLEWRHFVHGDFKGGYFFLKTAKNQFHYFPASVVPEKSAFVELVGRKIVVSKRWKNA